MMETPEYTPPAEFQAPLANSPAGSLAGPVNYGFANNQDDESDSSDDESTDEEDEARPAPPLIRSTHRPTSILKRFPNLKKDSPVELGADFNAISDADLIPPTPLIKFDLPNDYVPINRYRRAKRIPKARRDPAELLLEEQERNIRDKEYDLRYQNYENDVLQQCGLDLRPIRARWIIYKKKSKTPKKPRTAVMFHCGYPSADHRAWRDVGQMDIVRWECHDLYRTTLEGEIRSAMTPQRVSLISLHPELVESDPTPPASPDAMAIDSPIAGFATHPSPTPSYALDQVPPLHLLPPGLPSPSMASSSTMASHSPILPSPLTTSGQSAFESKLGGPSPPANFGSPSSRSAGRTGLGPSSKGLGVKRGRDSGDKVNDDGLENYAAQDEVGPSRKIRRMDSVVLNTSTIHASRPPLLRRRPPPLARATERHFPHAYFPPASTAALAYDTSSFFPPPGLQHPSTRSDASHATTTEAGPGPNTSASRAQRANAFGGKPQQTALPAGIESLAAVDNGLTPTLPSHSPPPPSTPPASPAAGPSRKRRRPEEEDSEAASSSPNKKTRTAAPLDERPLTRLRVRLEAQTPAPHPSPPTPAAPLPIAEDVAMEIYDAPYVQHNLPPAPPAGRPVRNRVQTIFYSVPMTAPVPRGVKGKKKGGVRRK